MRKAWGSAEKEEANGLRSPLTFLYKSIDGFAVIGHACLYNGLWPVSVMEAIWPELSFQSNTGSLSIVNTILALLVQIVAGIELYTGAIRVDFHSPAGNRVRQDGAGIAANFPVVVEASLQMQRLIVHSDIPADGLGSAEIHGGSLYRAQLAGGDVFSIIGIEETAGDGHAAVPWQPLACRVLPD